MTLLIDVRELNPTATEDEIGDAIALTAATNARAVCVLPTMLATAGKLNNQMHAETGTAVAISTVAGWPTGSHHTLVKASEARLAVDSGAQEVTVVLGPGMVVAGDSNALLSEAVTLRQAVPSPLLLTFGMDVCHLSDAQLIAAVQAVLPASPDGITVLRSDGGEVSTATAAAIQSVLPAGVGLRVDNVQHPQTADALAAVGVGVAVMADPAIYSAAG